MSRVVVAGVGNEHRRDDGVGIAVVRALRTFDDAEAVSVVVAHDPLDLLGRWEEAELAIVVDATRSNLPAGTVRTVEIGADPAASGSRSTGAPPSTHGLSVLDVLRIGRAAGAAPTRVVLVGIEGEKFGNGEEMTSGVAAAIPEAVAIVQDLAGL